MPGSGGKAEKGIKRRKRRQESGGKVEKRRKRSKRRLEKRG